MNGMPHAVRGWQSKLKAIRFVSLCFGGGGGGGGGGGCGGGGAGVVVFFRLLLLLALLLLALLLLLLQQQTRLQCKKRRCFSPLPLFACLRKASCERHGSLAKTFLDVFMCRFHRHTEIVSDRVVFTCHVNPCRFHLSCESRRSVLCLFGQIHVPALCTCEPVRPRRRNVVVGQGCCRGSKLLLLLLLLLLVTIVCCRCAFRLGHDRFLLAPMKILHGVVVFDL